MDLVNAQELRIEVTSEISNAPNPVVDRSIVQATRTLCDAVAVWQETDSLTSANGMLDLSDMEDDDREVVRSMPRGVSQSGNQLPQYTTPVPVSGDLGYFVQARRNLILTDTPPSTDFDVTAQMRPTALTLKIPADVGHDYHDTIVHGALYRLFRMPSESWGSADLAMMHFKLMQEGIKAARSDVHQIYAQV